MATKKATYKYDNGTGWDEIMFKTTADQVVESTTKRFVTDAEKSNWNTAVTRGNDWNSFKTGGGKIGGHVQLNKGNSFVIDGVGWIGTGAATEFEMIQTNKGKVVRVGTTDNLGNHLFMGLDGNDGVFGPSHNNLVSLGKSSNTFKDLWLGPSSKNSSGYIKLTNGLILQWAQIEARINGDYNITLPISFPNTCLASWHNSKSGQNNDEFDECQYTIKEWSNSEIRLRRFNGLYWSYPTVFAIGY